MNESKAHVRPELTPSDYRLLRDTLKQRLNDMGAEYQLTQEGDSRRRLSERKARVETLLEAI